MKPVTGTELGTVHMVVVAGTVYTRMNDEILRVVCPACDGSE